MQNSPRKSSLLRGSDAFYGGQYEAVLRLAHNLGQHAVPETLLRSIPRELHSIVLAEAIGFIPCRDILETAWFSNGSTDHAIPVDLPVQRLHDSLFRQASQSQQPMTLEALDLVLDYTVEDGEFIRQFRQTGSQSLCLLPLATAIRRIGLICIGRKLPEAFSPQEIRFLELVAEHIALAVDDRLNFVNSENARAQLDKEKTRLGVILDLNNSIVSTLELRSLLQAIAPRLRNILQLDAVALFLPEPGRRDLRLYALDFPGSKGIVRQDLLSSLDGTTTGDVFRSGISWTGHIEDLRGPELNRKMAFQEGIQTLCLLPLIRCGAVFAILSLARLRKDSFTDEEMQLLGQIANQVAIAVDNALAYSQIAELKEKLTQEKLYFEDEIRSEMNFEEIVGNSAVLRRVLRQIETVAPTDSTVLIYGETGSGKELIARAVHNLSRRHASAFVKLNCAAIPTGLLESELFGHEKGAFTGAIVQRIGRFELASHGTIFLDEIGEIPLELQPKLLRVLQEREFERLGGSRTLRTNARLIAATNRDLRGMVEENRFRSDLFYRLNVFPVHVPSLRERSEDIPLLVRHFVQHYSRNMNKHIDAISSETMQTLTRYAWPGNIRELQNVIERAVILSQGPVLNVPLADLRPRGALNGKDAPGLVTLEEVERRHILAVLEETNWVFAGPNGAAARLGMKRPTLQFRMQKLGISRPQRAPHPS
jgi:formate hydrogenlyase transcriptional activator